MVKSKIRDNGSIGALMLSIGFCTFAFSLAVGMGPPYRPNYLGLLIGFLMILFGAYLIVVSTLGKRGKREEMKFAARKTTNERKRIKEWVNREKIESIRRIAKEKRKRSKKRKEEFELETIKSYNCPYCELVMQHHLTECPECGTKL